MTTLPPLIDKIYSLGLTGRIYHTDRSFLEELDRVLWTYTPLSFIPHCLEGGEGESEAAFILTAQSAASAKADVFVALSPYDTASVPTSAKRVVDMFEGREEAHIQQARERWTAFQKAGLKCLYWTQTPEGKWEKTAETS